MPPHVPRKRLRSQSPHPESSSAANILKNVTPNKKTKIASNQKSPSSNAKANPKPTLQDNKAFLENDDSDDDDSSSSSGVDSDEFEDVIPALSPKRRKTGATSHSKASSSKYPHRSGEEDGEDEEDDDMAWEDTLDTPTADPGGENEPSGDLELTLDNLPTHTLGSLTNPHGNKKGPTKIERQMRLNTHCMHVQLLLYHNLVRNWWACDADVQKILVDGCTGVVKAEVERWKKDVGDALGEEQDAHKSNAGGKKKGKEKPKSSSKKHKNQRDWGRTADRLEAGAPNLSQGDPTLRLLKFLAGFWRKKFTVTAPGFRKKGYKDMARLQQERKAYSTNAHDSEEFGELVQGIEEFRKLAKSCQGSRDVGAQLFTALLRGLGVEARLVCNLQPIGFGWNKNEEAPPPKKKTDQNPAKASTEENKSDENATGVAATGPSFQARREKPITESRSKKPSTSTRKTRSGGSKEIPIDLSSDSELSTPPPSDSDESIIDVTPAKPSQPSKRYDRDLPFPIYWTEVLSPVTQSWIPVDPIVLSLVAGRADGLCNFEPRGSKADRAKQVMAYVVAFSSDGTAKDVTVRYLKRHMWPGKTKGVRMPVEKVPVYNKNGKVKRHEEFDWFKMVMSYYARSSQDRTPADDIEEARELQPVKIVREGPKAGEETLQGYKNSAEFVLERHLRREEALLPDAEQVKTFTTGKGDNTKEEPVFLRKDVVTCKTVESWHKEGREVKEGAQPLKHVPMRAVTLIRKREIEEAERESGEKMKQPLYSWNQTRWIIPPPIENGVIPKNAFGNMDVYVPSMVPKGAVHIPLRGTAKICKRLGIDFAEACTGFEFGNKRAVPILTGVVVAKENEDTVIDAWEVDEEQKRVKEETKREKVALGMWKKLLAGLRIVERVRQEYGEDAEAHIEEAIHPMASKKKAKAAKTANKPKPLDHDGDETMEGDFLIGDGDDPAEEGGFLRDDEKNEEGGFTRNGDEDAGGGFILDEDDDSLANAKASAPAPTGYLQTPISLQSLHQEGNEDDLSNAQFDGTGEEAPSSLAKKALNGRGKNRKAAETPKRQTKQSISKKKRVESPLESAASSSHDDDVESSSLSELSSSVSDDDEGIPPTRTKAAPAPMKSKRAAAQRSSQAVRSHYFADEKSDESDD